MRVVRVNELVKREISSILHTDFRDRSVRITISDVETAPNLQNATVFYGVFGGREDISFARSFFAKNGERIRMLLGKRIVLKYLPHLKFAYDSSLERGSRLNEIIDSLGEDGEPGFEKANDGNADV